MKKSSSQDKQDFDKLRIAAEKALHDQHEENHLLEEKDIQSLFQELQVHQIELEMQNDELMIANEQLEQQQLKFSSIYDLAPIGYFILDKNGMIDEVNNAGAGLFETGRSYLMGKRLHGLVAPEHSDTYYRFYQQMLASQKKQSCQLKMRSVKGHEFYAQVEGIAINPVLTSTFQCYLAIIDISERIRSEQNLAETKERLELALEASAAGTWELEMETMAFYLDEFNNRICSVPNDKFDGKYHTFINLIHPDDRQMVDEHFRTALNNEKEIDVVCRLINKSGVTCSASIRGHVVHDPTRAKRFVGIMMDITAKRIAEENTAKLILDQQKNIILATLNAGENERRRISDALHDGVSQLLYGIKIKLGMLDIAQTSPEMKDVNELLDMAIRETRNISFELAPSILVDFGLPAAVEELARRLSTKQMKIIPRVLGFNKRPDLLLETGIYRIVQELINNCMKHSGAGVVNIEIKKNKAIEIKVHDNGKGFNVKQQESVPSGSGLSSVKNRLSLYNGTLQIDSAAGSGTRVNITLKPVNT